ncbi:hypothetical protein [Lampropedia aestuarii]|uniref:hypothetical protein n=1 Tax=Lampropedia aestuarii TaxID=2562762 RepID=UPI002468863D|nr:hypothetical protein [Lampropedia aestuarii]MDH5856684.1 hypothetical protein [Lampropedia aestuarii]
MKKVSAVFLALACTFGFSSVHAAPAAITGAKIETTACDVLDESVAPSKSKDVHAAFDCSADANMIRVAACHVAGRKKAEKITCTSIGTGADGEPIFLGTCNATTAEIDSGTNGKAFAGTSSGGGIAAVGLAAACDATSINAPATIPTGG